MSRFNLTASALAALTVFGSLHAQAEIKDNLVTTTGKKIRGVEVLQAAATTVTFKQDGKETSMPANSLLDIEWHAPPESYVLGKAAMDKGQFGDAANYFAEAASKTEREPLKLEAQFFEGQALVRSAGADKALAGAAADKLQAFLSTAPKHFRAAAARLELGEAQLLAGRADDAAQTMKDLSDMAASEGLDPIWDARAKLALARAQTSAGKLNDARSSFRRAKSAAESIVATTVEPSPEVVGLVAASVVGEGDTYVAEQKFSEAVRYFERFQADKNQAIAAAALAGKGEALYLEAGDGGDSAKLRSAQIALAEANIADELGAETTAKALFYSGKVLLALGPDRETPDYQARALDYFKSVTTHYADTPWASKAAAELGR